MIEPITYLYGPDHNGPHLPDVYGRHNLKLSTNQPESALDMHRPNAMPAAHLESA